MSAVDTAPEDLSDLTMFGSSEVEARIAERLPQQHRVRNHHGSKLVERVARVVPPPAEQGGRPISPNVGRSPVERHA